MSRDAGAIDPECKENAAGAAQNVRHDQFVQFKRNLEELACRISDPKALWAERKKLIDEYESKLRRASGVERVAAARRHRPSLLRPPTARADTTARVEMANLTAHPGPSEVVRARAARLQVMSGQPPTQQKTQVITTQRYSGRRPAPSDEEEGGSPDDKINFLEAEYYAQADDCGNLNVVQKKFQTAQYTPPPGIQDTPLALLNVPRAATQNARISSSGQPAIRPPGSTSMPRTTGISRPGGSRQIPGPSTSRLPCPSGQRITGATGKPSTTEQSARATQRRTSTTPAPTGGPVTRSLPRPSGAIPKPATSRQSTATDTRLTETRARKSLLSSRTFAATGVCPPTRAVTQKSLRVSRQSSTAVVCPPAKTATTARRQTMAPSTGRSSRALSTTKMQTTDAAAKGAAARKSLPASRAQGRQIGAAKSSAIGSGKRLMTSFGPIAGLSQIAFSRPVDRKRYFKNIAQACDEDLESVEPPEYEDHLDIYPSPVTHRLQPISNWPEEEFAVLEQNVLDLQQQVTDPEVLQSQLKELMDVFEVKLKEARIIQQTNVRQEAEMVKVPPAAVIPALVISPPESKQALPSKLSGPKPTTSRKRVPPSRRTSTVSVCPPARTSTATRRQIIAPSIDAARRMSEARKSMEASRRPPTKIYPSTSTVTTARRQTVAPPTGRPSTFGRTISTTKRQSTDVALRAAAFRKSLPTSRRTSTSGVCPPAKTATTIRRQTMAPSTGRLSGPGKVTSTTQLQMADAARRMAAIRKSMGASQRASTASFCPPARTSIATRRQTIASSTGRPSAFGRTTTTVKRQSTDVALRAAASRESLPASRRTSTARVCPPAKTATAPRRQTIAASAARPSAPGKAKSTTKMQVADATRKMSEARKSMAASRRASTAAVARRQTIGLSSARPAIPGGAKSTTKMQPTDAATKAAARKSLAARGRSTGAARPSGIGPKKRLMTSFGPIEGMSQLTFSRPVERKRYFKQIGEEYNECLEDFAPPPFDYEIEGEPRPPGTERPLPIEVRETSRRRTSVDKSSVPSTQARTGIAVAAKSMAAKKIEKTFGPHKSVKSMKKPITSIQKRPRTIAGPVCPAAPRSSKAVPKVDSEILGGLKSRQQKGYIQQQKNLKLLRTQVLACKGGPEKPGKLGKDEDDKKKRRQSSRFEPKPGPSGVGKPKVPVKQPSLAAKKIHKEMKKKVEESQKSKAPGVSRTIKPKTPAPMPAKKAGSVAPKAVSRPAVKRESLLKNVAGDLMKRVAEEPGGRPIGKEETDEAFRIMALERKGMNLTGDPKDVANLLVPSNEPKLNAVGNAIESVNEGIVAANIPTSKINALNNLTTEEIGITLRSHPQPMPQTGLAAVNLEKVLLQLPAAAQCDYLECEVLLNNFTIENCFQPRGSAMPKWFPGMYTILPGEKTVMARTSPSNTLMKAWNELKPDFLKV